MCDAVVGQGGWVAIGGGGALHRATPCAGPGGERTSLECSAGHQVDVVLCGSCEAAAWDGRAVCHRCSTWLDDLTDIVDRAGVREPDLVELHRDRTIATWRGPSAADAVGEVLRTVGEPGRREVLTGVEVAVSLGGRRLALRATMDQPVPHRGGAGQAA